MDHCLYDPNIFPDSQWIYVLVYRKRTHIEQYLHYSSHPQICCKESVVCSLFNRAYSIITNKNNLRKKNGRRKQVGKENGYKESITSKTLRDSLTITAFLGHSN